MSRTLDRLITMHKQNRQNRWHIRRYSAELSATDKKLDDAFRDLGRKMNEVLNNERHIVNGDEQVAEILALPPEEYKEVEKDLQQGDYEEKNDYRYEILPRIYSDLRRIDSSPQLARKLISYYLRNKRKEKMYRLYGQKKHYSGRIIADQLIHEMYMELGRTLYFARLYNNANNLTKDKKTDISTLRGLYESFRGIADLVTQFMIKLQDEAIREKIATKGGISSAITAFVIYILAGIIQEALRRPGFGIKFIAFVGLFVVVFGVGFIGYFIFKAITTYVIPFLTPKAFLTYVRGYRLMTKFVKAFSKLLGDIKVLDLVNMLTKCVKATTDGDNESKESVMGYFQSVTDNISSDTKLSDFFLINQSNLEQVKEAIERGKNLNLRISAIVKNEVGKVISPEFPVSAYIVYDKSERNAQLPPELEMLIVLTSPQIDIYLSAGQAQALIKFNAWRFCEEYGGLDISEVKEFLDSYMQAFAKKRDKLSEYLKSKIAEVKA